MPDLTSSNPQFSDPLLQRFFLSPEEKASKEKGKQIVKAFYAAQTNNDISLNYFKRRNARWIELLLWAKGSQRMQEFLGFMSVSDANRAYIALDLEQTRIAAQFVGVLVESYAKNKTVPCVYAIDDGSLDEKEKRMLEALFRMHEADVVNQLQQQAGMQLEAPNAYVPDDEMAAKVYFQLEDRLPKEIRFEELLTKIQDDIKFEKVLNRKTLFDLVVLNAGFTKIECLGPGQYVPIRCVPTNMIYNFFLNDTGEHEISEIGYFYNVKVRDFRSKYGISPERPNGLSEKQIYELAKISTNKNIGTFNYMWQDNWALTTYNLDRPYDDCSILVLDCEIDCGEDVYYVEKTDSFGKKNLTAKKNIPYQQKTKDGIVSQPKPDNVEIIKRPKQTWMRGVYAPYGDTMLYWGPPDLIITEYTNVYKPLSSFTANIPFNDGEYVPSLFERIMEPLREYQITKLKRKQIISLIEPDGYRIDIEAARSLDLGNGDTIDWLELVRIKNQLGVELYTSKGVDGITREAPAISAGTQSSNISKVIELTNVLAAIVNEIRQLIGTPTYRDGSDVGDRTAAKLAEGQNQSSYNVTDFILNANNQLWEDTYYKICLLKWNDIVKSEPESKDDMINSRFKVTVKMKSTDYQRQLLEQDIQRFSQVVNKDGNPALSPKDAIMLREIEDYKLACFYLASTVEKNKRDAQKAVDRATQLNAQAQAQSNQQAGQQALQQLQAKMQIEAQMDKAKLEGAEKLAIINGIFMVAAKNPTGELPDYLKPLATQVIQNVAIPLVAENSELRGGLNAMQNAQAAPQQPQPGQEQQQ